MTTIFTDDYAYTETSIELNEQSLGEKGRELIFSTADEREFRVKLSDEQLHELADVLLLAGYEQREN
tara:strand:+ start:71 stop:271 length:201 start_codon:yes stop_codon:yes gene_type:complete